MTEQKEDVPNEYWSKLRINTDIDHIERRYTTDVKSTHKRFFTPNHKKVLKPFIEDSPPFTTVLPSVSVQPSVSVKPSVSIPTITTIVSDYMTCHICQAILPNSAKESHMIRHDEIKINLYPPTFEEKPIQKIDTSMTSGMTSVKTSLLDKKTKVIKYDLPNPPNSPVFEQVEIVKEKLEQKIKFNEEEMAKVLSSKKEIYKCSKHVFSKSGILYECLFVTNDQNKLNDHEISHITSSMRKKHKIPTVTKVKTLQSKVISPKKSLSKVSEQSTSQLATRPFVDRSKKPKITAIISSSSQKTLQHDIRDTKFIAKGHYKPKYTYSKLHICDVCSLTFMWQHEAKSHIHNHKLVCRSYESDMRKNITYTTLYACNTCGVKHYEKEHINSHIIMAHEKKLF